VTGPLYLVGGDEWQEGCDFDAGLLADSGGDEVVVLPTAAAYEAPDALVQRAESWFGGLGGRVRAIPVYGRTDALDTDLVAAVRSARAIYLSSGSPMHLRSVLKDSPLLEAITHAWRDGAVLAGSAAGAVVWFDFMVDPRGGAYTVGVGLLSGFTVIPRFDTWSHDKARRTVDLAAAGMAVAGVPDRTALVHREGRGWSVAGVGEVAVWVDGRPADLSALPTPEPQLA
jgi:cyanophycinase